MSYNKEYAIAAQNAATAAATLLGGTGASKEQYDDVREHIFKGTLALAGAESVIVAFEGESYAEPQAVSTPQVVQSYAPAAPASGPNELDSFVVNSGKHSGKTFAQIRAEDPGWLTWASDNLKNDFVRRKAQQYLAA